MFECYLSHHLYNSTAKIPDTIAINKPLVPKYLITIPPSSVKLNTNKIYSYEEYKNGLNDLKKFMSNLVKSNLNNDLK